VVDRVLLRPLPYPDSERIVLLQETGPKVQNMDVNPGNWLDWQRDSRTFDSFAAWTDRIPSTLTGQGEPERLESEFVSHEFLSVLGVRPMLGSDFTAAMDQPGVTPSAILSYSLWQRKLGGDPNIIGDTIELNSTAVQIVGVMLVGFQFISRDTQIWRVMGLPRNLAWRERGGRFLPYVVARVKSAVAPAAAKVELESIAQRLAQTYSFNRNTSVAIVPLREVLAGQVKTSLWILFAAVGVLLLVACFNVANLLIARSPQRRREIAIRGVLGAGRGAIARQLLIESAMLSLIGGIAGVVVARSCLSVLLLLAPARLLPGSGVGIDQPILWYTLGLSVLTGAVVGLIPAGPSIRLAIADYLRDGGRSVTRSVRLRQVLLIMQVAMTMVLLSGAGLLVRSLLKLSGDPIGVEPKNVLTMRVELPGSRYNDDHQVRFFNNSLSVYRTFQVWIWQAPRPASRWISNALEELVSGCWGKARAHCLMN
jgi:predicted permease